MFYLLTDLAYLPHTDFIKLTEFRLSCDVFVTPYFIFTIRYDTIEEFNVDSKAEYTA